MLIFASIFGVGFLVLIISMVFGTDHDVDVGGGDADFGHDVSDATHGPSVFSFRIISLLLVGFGAVGFGFRATTSLSMFQSSMAGIGGAVAVGALGYLIIRMFYSSQTSSTISDQDIIGLTGNLIDAIHGDQNGQISCIVRGREITYLARSVDGQSINRGASVRIIEKAGSIVVVKPVKD
jgi:membrane-bound ClpP family serine protease